MPDFVKLYDGICYKLGMSSSVNLNLSMNSVLTICAMSFNVFHACTYVVTFHIPLSLRIKQFQVSSFYFCVNSVGSIFYISTDQNYSEARKTWDIAPPGTCFFNSPMRLVTKHFY